MRKSKKHILKRASALFLMVALLFTFTGEPVSAAALKAGLTGRSYYTYLGKSADGKYYVNQDDHSLKQVQYKVDYGGKKWTGYCMSPGKGFHNNVTYHSSKYSASSAWKSLSAAKQELLALVMFYGYNAGLSSPSGNNNDYYEATQVLVWEVMDGDVKLSSDKRGIVTGRKHTHYNRIKGRKYGVNCYNKIKENIGKHLKGASFASKTKSGASTYLMHYDYKTKTFKRTLTDANKNTSYGQKLAAGSTSGLRMIARDSAGDYNFSASKKGTYTAELVNNVPARTSQPLMILRPSRLSDQNVVLGAVDETRSYVKFRTEDTGKCKIIKTSPDGAVKGFNFRLTCAGNGYDKTFTTDAEGTITASLYPGTYKWTEVLTSAQKKAGYSQKSGTVTIKEDQTAQVNVANSRHEVEFRLEKTSDDGTKQGFKFRIKGAAANMTAYDKTFITDNDGFITADIYPGTYTVTEILTKEQQEAGFVPAEKKTFTVTATTKDPYVIKVHNRVEKPSGMRILKEVEGRGGVDGFRFSVKREPGPDEEPFETLVVTDENGIADVNDISAGTYTVKEILTEEQKRIYKEPQEKTVEIKDDKNTVAFVRVTNELKREKVGIIKKSIDPKDNVSGIYFRIAGRTVAGENVIYDNLITDENGRIDITLYPGEYRLDEKNIDTEKYADPGTKEFTVTPEDCEDEKAFEVTFVNRPYAPLNVIKLDAGTGGTLAGATLEVWDKEGKEVLDSWVSGGEPHEVNGLLYGEEYILREKEAPKGYVAFEDKPFTAGEQNEIKVEDRKTEMTVTKTDGDTKEPLKGAVMAVIVPETGVTVCEFESGEDGKYTLKGLEEGKTYVLREKKAPAGYIEGKDMEFTFTDGMELTYENRKPGIKTVAYSDDTGTHMAEATEQVYVTDNIYMDGLRPGDEYTLSGKLIDKETGDEMVRSTDTVFTAEEEKTVAEVKFAFDGREMAGRDTVIFEELKRDGEVIATHEDITSNDQSISFPEIGTYAFDKETGKKELEITEKRTVTDRVDYSNVQKDEEYIIKGQLVNKKNGRVITESEKEFTAEDTKGSIELDYELKPVPGTRYVIYEDLYVKDDEGSLKKVASHRDKDNKDQTVYTGTVFKTGDIGGIFSYVLLFVTCALILLFVTVRKWLTKE